MRTGEGCDRISTFLVLFAPWDRRSIDIVRFKDIPDISVFIYLTSESLSEYGARLFADSHIMVQQTVSFSAFDVKDPSDRGYYRMLVHGGQDQSVCSVEGARTIATINTFDDLIDNGEKTHGHQECTSDVPAPTTSTTTRWIEAISLLTMVRKPVNPGCRLCPACLLETPAVLSLCLSCKGYLISHGWRHRLRKSVTTETLD